MAEYNSTQDSLTFDQQVSGRLPQGINVLTILTFIGCAIFGLLTLATPWLTKFSKSMMDKAVSSGRDLTPKQLTDMEKTRTMMELTEKNMIPLLLIGIAGIVLCFIGALMMRKLKKDGFWIYVAGQVVPLIGSAAILGTAQYSSPWSYAGLVFPIVFIVLYATQRKHLVR